MNPNGKPDEADAILAQLCSHWEAVFAAVAKKMAEQKTASGHLGVNNEKPIPDEAK